MNLLFWGLTIKTAGEIIIGLAIIAVHLRIMKEHKLDAKVYKSIRNEKFWGLIGILFVLAGYLLEIAYYTEVGVI